MPTPTTTKQQHAPDLDRAPEAWGAWRIPETEVGALGTSTGSTDLTSSSTVAAPPSGRWRSRRAARAFVGLDHSQSQLSARRRRIRSGTCSGDARLRERRRSTVRRLVVRPRVLRPRCAVVLRSERRRLRSAPACSATVDGWCSASRRPSSISRRTATGTTRPVVSLNRWEAEWKFNSVEGTVDFVWSHGEWIRVVPPPRLRDRRPDRTGTAPGRDHDLHGLRPVQVGPPVAGRADLVRHTPALISSTTRNRSPVL